MSCIRYVNRFVLIIFLLSFMACEREQRHFRENPPAATDIQQRVLQPGQAQCSTDTKGPYADNAFAVSEGKRLFEWYNCTGCHAHGGGDIGPPLMDDKWIYGSQANNIFATIMEGRPNGMPSFRGKLTDQQTWQIVAYVRSMSGQLRKDISPSRDDNMSMKTPEQSQEKEIPKSHPAEQPK